MPDATWNVTYPDNKTLNAKLQMGSLLGGPEGAMSIDDLMGKMYAWKMRALEDARNMAPAAPRPAPTLSQATPTPYVPERMPFRDMMQAKSMLDRDMYSANGTRVNRDFQNLPAAAAMTGMQLPQSGWDLYAKMLAGAAPTMQQAIGSAAQSEDTRTRAAAGGWGGR